MKTYFALSAATHDAACAAWSLKRYYEGVRPITLIRYMGSKGQSSDPLGPSYHPEGLPLEAGVVEVITSSTASVGGRHHGVGSVGDIVVYSWPGEPANPATQTSNVRWIKARDWVPYQRKTFNTPAFPGYVSGHSTFSRAAAEVLAAITGSSFFPGGLGTFTANANSYLVFERGPSQNVALQWATYFDAADQAGQSRLWGGIHVQEDDFTGRTVGSQTGIQAWILANKYWDASIIQESISPMFSFEPGNQVKVQWECRRGLYYKIQSSPDLLNWSDASFSSRAANTAAAWLGTMPSTTGHFYRVFFSPTSQ
ncbi:MAG: vanadium-dependent haloperoxidase [Verrucomicrobiaceae bacterium]|nr:vanadium-dependent haloperoxidase [Verrucomicrobiaceae bacterium]